MLKLYYVCSSPNHIGILISEVAKNRKHFGRINNACVHNTISLSAYLMADITGKQRSSVNKVHLVPAGVAHRYCFKQANNTPLLRLMGTQPSPVTMTIMPGDCHVTIAGSYRSTNR